MNFNNPEIKKISFVSEAIANEADDTQGGNSGSGNEV